MIAVRTWLVVSLVAAIPVLGATVSLKDSPCHTVMGKTSRSTVPTRTTTTTHFVGPTHTVKSGTFTHTGPIAFITTPSTTVYYTFYDIIATTTTTVPLPRGFTPLISAKSVAALTKTRAERAARSSASSPASYPQSVLCTKSVTKTDRTVTRPATTTTITPTAYTDYDVLFTITSATTHEPASTAFAVCEPTASNVLSAFDGHAIVDFSYPGSSAFPSFASAPYTLPDDCAYIVQSGACHFAGDAQKSPMDCCVAASFYNEQLSMEHPHIMTSFAFAYYQNPGEDPVCELFRTGVSKANTDWNFTLGKASANNLHVGNLVGGRPYYIAST